MDATTEALTPTVSPRGLVLALVGGAVAAGVMGFIYHLIANKAGLDYIIALAAILGAVVGFVVGQVSRVGGLRALMVVTVIAFVFGVAGYAARYYFELNDQIETAMQEFAVDAEASGVSLDELRGFILAGLAEEYPPGGLVGYMQFLAEAGFSIGSRGSDSADAPIQGPLAWGLLGIEALAAGIVAAGTARGIVRKSQAMLPAGSPPPSAPTGQWSLVRSIG